MSQIVGTKFVGDLNIAVARRVRSSVSNARAALNDSSRGSVAMQFATYCEHLPGDDPHMAALQALSGSDKLPVERGGKVELFFGMLAELYMAATPEDMPRFAAELVAHAAADAKAGLRADGMDKESYRREVRAEREAAGRRVALKDEELREVRREFWEKSRECENLRSELLRERGQLVTPAERAGAAEHLRVVGRVGTESTTADEAARDAAIVLRAAEEDTTHQMVADEFGITRGRVSQIVRKHREAQQEVAA